MTADEFLKILTEKSWASKGDNTLNNRQFNNYEPGDWRYDQVLDNEQYYPPGNVGVKVHALDVTRAAYSMPHGDHEVHVPASVIKTFRLELSGDDFAGKELLNSARFIVLGDHAISSPMSITNTKSVVIHVRLFETDKKKMIMVNELIWSVQYEDEQTGGQTFYDIQKWYCCGYP